MNKKNYLWWVVGLVAIILAVYLLVSLTGKGAPKDSEASQASEIPAVSQTASTSLNTPPARTPEPIEKPEFMTDAEKVKMNIDKKDKVQVLERMPDGTIGAYKFIHSDEDVLTSF